MMKASAITRLLLIGLATFAPALACSITGTATPPPATPHVPATTPIPTATPIVIDENGYFSVTVAGAELTVAVVASDRGNVSGLKVTTAELDPGVMVIVTDPDRHYLPEIHFLSPAEHERIQIGVKARQTNDQELLQSSLRVVHNINATALAGNLLGDATLDNVWDVLAPHATETDFGLLAGVPDGATSDAAMNVYESTAPGVFLALPANHTGQIETLLVLTFTDLPSTPLTALIESREAEVQIVDFTGLTPEDIARLQHDALATQTGNK